MDELTLFDMPEAVVVEAQPVDERRKQLRTMHQDHGIAEGKTCGECSHLCRGKYNTTVYFKCELYVPWTHGPGTDWRRFWQACGKFEPQESA